MKFKVTILSILCSFLYIIAQASPDTTAKLQKVIIDSEAMTIFSKKNTTLLKGNVVLIHNNIVMTCDSAYQFPNDKFEAYGNVRIVNGTTIITGDEMIYDGLNNLAQVRGEIVYLTDGTSTLRTSTIDYDTKEEIGFFQNEGTIKDPQSLLESKQGYYYSKLKDFVFNGRSVQAKTENYTLTSDSMKYNTDYKIFDFYLRTHIWSNNSFLYCDKGWYDTMNEKMFFLKNSYLMSEEQEVWADSIYYESFTKEGKLYRNIQLLDTLQKTIAFGDFSDFNFNTNNFEITKEPSLIFYSAEQPEDTIFIRAERLKSITTSLPSLLSADMDVIKDSTYREIFAIKDVRIFKNDMQASCDSLYFNTLDSIWKMYHTPILWNGRKMQLTGDTIKFFMLDGKMDRVEFQNNSMIIMPENDSSEYYNQIKGKNMTGYFRNNDLQSLNIFGNIQSLFFSTDEQAMSQHEAGSMTIRFLDRKVNEVAYYNKPIAKAIPFFMVEEGLMKLKGFYWYEDKRPKSRYDILQRFIRASKRNEINLMKLPQFPITERINKQEEEMLKNKTQ